MRWLSRLARRVRDLVSRDRVEREMDDELRSYVEAVAAEKMRRGLAHNDGWRAARLEVGTMDAIKDSTRDVGWESLIDGIRQDVRYAVRGLIRSAGFTTVAILTLAFGIGANTAIFSLANGLLFREGGMPSIDRVVALSRDRGPNSISRFALKPAEYRTLEENRGAAFDRLFSSDPLSGALSMATHAEIVSGELVSGEYFDALGVRPTAGRLLSPRDDVGTEVGSVVVISDRLWQTWFNRDPSAIGTVTRMAGYPLTVIGVAPREFHGTWLPTMLAADVWVPMTAGSHVSSHVARGDPGTTPWTERSHRTFARLRSGVSVLQAGAAIATIEIPPDDGASPTFTLLPAVRAINFDDFFRPGLLIGTALVALSSLVFLIACANLTNLLLARATGRTGELGVRLAIGAGRARIFRLVLTEVLIITGLAGGVGWLLTAVTTRLMLRVPLPTPEGIHITFNPSPDWRVFAFALGIAVTAALAVGLVPAWRASRTNPLHVLAMGGAGGSTTRRQRLRAVLVAAQVAMSVVLVLLAGLYVRSAIRGMRFDPGFDMSRTTIATVDMGLQRFDEARGRRVQRRMLEAAGRVAGVERAALASGIPAAGTASSVSQLAPEEQPLGPVQWGAGPPAQNANGQTGRRVTGLGPFAQYARVSPGFFATLGIPLRRGRDFTDADGASAPGVVIVSESVATKFWPGQDAVGHRLTTRHDGPLLEVVGVVATTATTLRIATEDLFIYLPAEQEYSDKMSVIVRTGGDAHAMIEPLARAMRSVDPELAVVEATTVADAVGFLLTPIRVTALVLGTLGTLGLSIALLGIYGVMAYFVSQRTREFGIRKALGATSTGIYAVVLRSSLRMLLFGAIPGIVIAFIAAGFLRYLLYGIAPHDPVTFVIVPLGLVTSGLAAAAIAARRAARVDPNVALRQL